MWARCGPPRWLTRTISFPVASRRTLTSTTHCDLAHDICSPPNVDESKAHRPLLILHGFLGSKRNWTSLCKAFARDLERPVYTLDLRSHGSSPHREPLTYTDMADDVLKFCDEHRLEGISLLGHSMGGKVAMALALAPSVPQKLLANLIIADITPARGAVDEGFKKYVAGMQRVEDAKVRTRQQADAMLAEIEPDRSIRAFLLTNLSASDPSHLTFRIPLRILAEAIPEIGGFPYEPSQARWHGRVLFIKGTRSKYINERTIRAAREYFPIMELAELDAGHWVHAEKPNEFLKIVVDFIQRTS